MRDDFDELMALHDGELPAQEASEAEDRLDDPEAREFLARLAKADEAFTDAADELLDMPVPPKLVEAIRQSQPQTAEIIPFPRRRGIVGLAVAAGLAAVIATNTQLFQSPTSPATDHDAASYAALLQEVMESVPSGEVLSSSDGAVSIAPMVSFKTDAATFCREFMSSRDGAEFSGVACRDNVGSWTLQGELQALAAPAGESYRAAEGQEGGGKLPPALVKAAELSYAEEQEAIRSGWKDSGRERSK